MEVPAGNLTHRPERPNWRNQDVKLPAPETQQPSGGGPVWSPLRARPRTGTDANAPTVAERTGPVMPNQFHAGYSPLRTAALTVRPEMVKRRPTKAISRVDPAVIATDAADPAVLVKLHGDLRLSLGQLEKDLGKSLAKSWTVLEAATGHISLASDAEPGVGFTNGLCLDARQRLQLSAGIKHRLAVGVGGQVLVSASPDGRSLRLINLGTLADAFSALAPQPPGDDT